MPSEDYIFNARVDPDSPPTEAAQTRKKPCLGLWWRRRVLPPGPLRLLHKAFIAIVVKRLLQYSYIRKAFEVLMANCI